MKEYLTVNEWAEREGINPATVRQRISRGATKAIKMGRDWMIPASEKRTDGRLKNENR